MYNAIMVIALFLSLIFSLYVALYINEQPFVVLIEDNRHREADLVCLPMPGVRCEE